MISFTLNGWNAQAANVIPTDYRLDTDDDNFADARKFMVVFKVRPRQQLRAKRVELAIGTHSISQENRLFVLLGRMHFPTVTKILVLPLVRVRFPLCIRKSLRPRDSSASGCQGVDHGTVDGKFLRISALRSSGQ